MRACSPGGREPAGQKAFFDDSSSFRLPPPALNSNFFDEVGLRLLASLASRGRLRCILGMCARSRTSVPPPNATSLLRSPPSCVCIMTLLGPAAACLALLEASARTDASREALRAAGIGTAMPAWCHPISDVVKSHEPGPRPPPHYPPGTAGTCCANGICVVGKRRPVQAPAAFSTSGVCSPVGIDNALAIVDSAIAKVTCWTAPIPLPMLCCVVLCCVYLLVPRYIRWCRKTEMTTANSQLASDHRHAGS